MEKYLRIEITDDYKVNITPTDSDGWVGQYYTTLGVITGTTCLESKKEIFLSKMLDKALADIEAKFKPLVEGKENLTQLKNRNSQKSELPSAPKS